MEHYPSEPSNTRPRRETTTRPVLSSITKTYNTIPSPSSKTLTIFLILVFAVLFLCIVITSVNYVTVLSGNKETSTKETGLDEQSHVKKLLSHVVSLRAENDTYRKHMTSLAVRFPYVVAVTRNSSKVWRFACFASLVLMKWIVTVAHCRLPGHTHRAILYYDFVRNYTHTFPILFWRLHDKYNRNLLSPKYDIAVAKLNTENYPFQLQSSVIDESMATEIEASVWKTLATMDKQLYLTNQFDKYDVKIDNAGRCFERYGIEIDEALICVDMSEFHDCFTHDFGPIYSGDKFVGLILIKPMDCDMKFSIFANISYYTGWILKTTRNS